MTIQSDTAGILDFLTYPGFCVQNNIITRVNQAAAAMLLTVGTDVRDLMLTGAEEYKTFSSGCLYLTLNVIPNGWGTSVIRRDQEDIFLMDHGPQDGALRALALAARELRSTLAGSLISADQMAQQADPENAQLQEQLGRLNHSLNRTLRIIGNMSDAEDWPHQNRQEIREIGGVLQEIFEKSSAFMESADIRLTYEGLREDIYTLIDREQLERAILNILSNAMKFTPKGGHVRAALKRSGRILRLTIQDSGSGIPENIRSTLFSRYLRQGAIEDSRYGLGLGMSLIRSAAAAHGGTVLVEQPENGGTRITMTVAIRQDTGAQFRSPVLHPDYAGGRDHTLLELSDCLPYTLYK